MKKIINYINEILPNPSSKILANRLFIIILITLSIDGWFFGVKEGFICVITAFVCYLCNLEYSSKKIIFSRTIHIYLLSIVSIVLGTINPLYISIIAPLYTFFLVIFEKDDYHKGMPIFFLPLVMYVLSLNLSLDFIFQRNITILIGIIVALIANIWAWPSKESKNLIPGQKYFFSSYKIKYALRKSVGVSFILIVGGYFGEGAAIWGTYLFLILHSPIDTAIFPKVRERIGGTILGGILYIPLGYMIKSKSLIYILAILALYLALIFIGQCYYIAVSFITLNVLLYSVGTFPFEIILTQRLIFAILGGGVAFIVSILIPLKKHPFAI